MIFDFSKSIKVVFFAVLFFACFHRVQANTPAWVNVGAPAFSEGSADYTSMAIDSTGIPYVAYKDNSQGGKLSVKKFNGTNWITVGSLGISDGSVRFTSIKLDSNNFPYVAFDDESLTEHLTVVKFNGASWQVVGSAGFSNGPGGIVSLAIDHTDIPYVAYEDFGYHNSYDGRSKEVVMKFNGAGWEEVGPVGGISPGEVNDSSLAFDSLNNPYVAYDDWDPTGTNTVGGYSINVLKFNGATWEHIGSSNFSTSATFTSFKLDSNDVPYVGFTGYPDTNANIEVMKFDGVNWVDVGTPGFSGGFSSYTTLALDSNNIPYITFKDILHDNKTSVMKFNGTNWVDVGTPGFSDGSASYTFLTIDSNNNPYVSYIDGGNGDKVTVMKFDSAISDSKALATFSIAGQDGNTIIDQGNNTITINLPYGTDRSALVPSFITTGASVKIGSTVQTSGITTNDFSSPVIYTITATDTTTRDYTITVNHSIATKAITSFSIPNQVGSTVIDQDNFTITIHMYSGSGLTSLIPNFVINGVSLYVGSTIQANGITANNFSSPVTYTVTGADSLTQDYVVSIINSAPVASNLSISGYPNPGETLTAEYTYTDADLDPEGDSIFVWLKDKNVITGETSRTYVVRPEDVGSVIKFKVTPVSLVGTSPGIEVTFDSGIAIVAMPDLTGITITSPATKLIYSIGDTLDISGLVVKGIYTDSSLRPITITAGDISGFNSNTAYSNQVLTITYQGQTTTYSVTISSPHRYTSHPPIDNTQSKFQSGSRGRFIFQKNLFYGKNDTDIIELQKKLNQLGFIVATTGPGSKGLETNFFGRATRTALIKFQNSHNIKPAVGFFGPITRKTINEIN